MDIPKNSIEVVVFCDDSPDDAKILSDDIASNRVVGVVGDIVFGGVVSGGGVVGGLRMIFGGHVEPLA